jgi:anti-sigma28 factor (negative regulator of flagellin synthesis)
VYCKECLQKIKDGTMQPVRRGTRPVKQPKVNTADLALLGIEFKVEDNKPDKQEKAPAPSAPKRAGPGRKATGDGLSSKDKMPPRKASILEGAEDVPAKKTSEPTSSASLSLADLESQKKSKQKKEHSRPSVNVEELRQAIAESLGKDDGTSSED